MPNEPQTKTNGHFNESDVTGVCRVGELPVTFAYLLSEYTSETNYKLRRYFQVQFWDCKEGLFVVVWSIFFFALLIFFSKVQNGLKITKNKNNKAGDGVSLKNIHKPPGWFLVKNVNKNGKNPLRPKENCAVLPFN